MTGRPQPQRPPAPPNKPADDDLIFMTHAPGSLTPPRPAEDSDDLIFMTHAPGARVPPRPKPEEHESLMSSVLLGPFRVRRNAPARAATVRRSMAARLQEGAGRAALERAREAGRRSAAKRRFRPPDLSEPLPGASEAVDVVPENVVVSATPLPNPSYLAQVPGALFAPLRGFPVAFVQAFLLGIGLLLFELSVPIGLVGAAIGLGSLANLSVRMIRDGCGGRDAIVWPDLGALLPSILLASAALLNLVPAVALAILAWGPGAWSGPGSLPARAVYAVSGPSAPPTAAPDRPERAPSFGHYPLRVLDAAVAARVDGPRTSTSALAESLQRHAEERARDLATLPSAPPTGQAAAVAALLGLLLAPIGYLLAVRIRSAYGAIFLPITLRSILRVAGPYLIPLTGIACWVAAIGATAFGGPALLRAELGPTPGHLAWIAALSLVLTGGAMINASLLARLYRTRQLVLAWD